MAIASQPPRLSRADSLDRVASPLQQLRSKIRLYVSLEGLVFLVLFLASMFWLGLACDFGFFKLTGLDWIQILPYQARAVVLSIALAALVGVVLFKMVRRLWIEFRDPALALLLERRFPAVLGDRLITAIELADPRKSERYGYSQVMVEQTIRDAAERVGKVDVNTVFNWRRLIRAGLLCVALTVCSYVLVGAVYCGWEQVKYVDEDFPVQREGFGSFSQRFQQVATIWFERNVLLRQVPWPRRAFLEFVDFAEAERHIGRDSPPLNLTLIAHKWVVADADLSTHPDGWRPMVWGDLSSYLDSSPNLPANLVPASWSDADVAVIPIDVVELALAKLDGELDEPTQTVKSALEQLAILASEIPRQRQLRNLEVPTVVRLFCQGRSIDNEQALEVQIDYRYACTLPELKDNVRLWARGADYTTPRKEIMVEPPPELESLTRDEDQPAYLYLRLPRNVDPKELLGLRQQIHNQPVSLSGDTCRLDLPLGTNLTLTAIAKTKLKSCVLKAIEGNPKDWRVELSDLEFKKDNKAAFRTQIRAHFGAIKAPIEFLIEMTDAYNVVGTRHVVIKPVEDLAPEVDVQVEVVRKTNQGYLITAAATVFFSGKMKDDHSLAHGEYRYTLARLDTQPSASVLALLAARTVTWSAAGPLTSAASLARETIIRSVDEQEKPPKNAPLRTFAAALREKDGNTVLPAQLPELLAQSPRDPTTRDLAFLKEFTLDKDTEYFDVQTLGLKIGEENARYQLRLSVVAFDNNIETGTLDKHKFWPHRAGEGQSKETFTLIVVSEYQLLAEIAREEEGLYVKLEDAVNRLKEARLKLERTLTDLPGLTDEEMKRQNRATVDTGEVMETIIKTGDMTREVWNDYRHILLELRANRVQQGMIKKVGELIVEPLDIACREDFSRLEKSTRSFQKELKAGKKDPAPAQKAMDDMRVLLDRLNNVLSAMENVGDINKLIGRLVEIEKSEAEAENVLKAEHKRLVDKILEDLQNPEKKP